MLFIEVLVRGIAMGSVYALMGLGLTLILGVMRVVNFAQGEFYMIGAYVIFYVMTSLSFPFYVAIPAGMLVMFCLGLVVEKLLLSPAHGKSVQNAMEYSLIITFAISIFLQKVAILAFGPFFRKLPDYLAGNVSLGPISMSGNLFLAMVLSTLLIVAVTLFLNHTRTGRSWRALAQSLEGASITGVRIDRQSGLVFGLSAALAAAAGGILAPITLIFPSVGAGPLVKGYEIIAIGGLGSVPGSLAGGLALGVVEALGSVYINSAYKDIYGFALLMLFLIFRPKGLFGQAAAL
ncbi:MAG: branched-chain amino acid ABC transporter permease [Chloroflexota bacterium]